VFFQIYIALSLASILETRATWDDIISSNSTHHIRLIKHIKTSYTM